MALHTKISDEKPGSILNSLAKSLNAKIKEKLNECILEIPDSVGTGKVKLLSFSQGVSIITVNLKLKNVVELTYDDGVVHPLKIILLKNGSISHSFKKADKLTKINTYESVIIASTPESNHFFLLPRNKEISFLSIQINRKLFEPKVEEFFPTMHIDLSKILRDVNGIQEFYHKNFYNQESLKIVEEIFANSTDDFIESVLVEGLTYQLITLQLRQYLINEQLPASASNLGSKTRLKLSSAVDLIENNIESYTTVKNLAEEVGINEKTLQTAFKQYYDCTVNAYVQKFRAYRARMLVETTDFFNFRYSL